MGVPSRVRVTGPLERYAAGFVAELVEAGYRPNAAAVQLRLLKHLSGWLEQEGIDPGDLREAQLERFRREHLARVASLRTAQGLARLLGYLRSLGVVPRVVLPARSTVEVLLDRYRAYLLVERGVTAETARAYVDLVQPFVVTRVRDDEWCGARDRGLSDCRCRPMSARRWRHTCVRVVRLASRRGRCSCVCGRRARR